MGKRVLSLFVWSFMHPGGCRFGFSVLEPLIDRQNPLSETCYYYYYY